MPLIIREEVNSPLAKKFNESESTLRRTQKSVESMLGM